MLVFFSPLLLPLLLLFFCVYVWLFRVSSSAYFTIFIYRIICGSCLSWLLLIYSICTFGSSFYVENLVGSFFYSVFVLCFAQIKLFHIHIYWCFTNFSMLPISLEFSSICWAILIWLMNEHFWNCRLRGTEQLVLFNNIWCSCNHGCHSFHRSLVQKICWMFMNWLGRLNWTNAINSKIINIQPTQTLQLQINKCTVFFFLSLKCHQKNRLLYTKMHVDILVRSVFSVTHGSIEIVIIEFHYKNAQIHIKITW